MPPKKSAKSATKTRPAKTAPTTVAAYLATHAPPMRALLKTARETIRTTVPEAKEDIAYGLIRYKLDGQTLVYIAGWKQHWSLYPAYPSVIKALEGEAGSYEIDKQTLRFSGTAAVPAKLVAKIARLRAEEVRGGLPTSKAKAKAKTKAKAKAKKRR